MNKTETKSITMVPVKVPSKASIFFDVWCVVIAAGLAIYWIVGTDNLDRSIMFLIGLFGLYAGTSLMSLLSGISLRSRAALAVRQGNVTHEQADGNERLHGAH